MQHVRWKEHWEALRRHKLFVAALLLLAPLIGQMMSQEQGFLFGWLVSIIAVVWLWGEGHN